MFVGIAAGVILGVVGLAAQHDHRERHRGYTVSVGTDEARDTLREVTMFRSIRPSKMASRLDDLSAAG